MSMTTGIAPSLSREWLDELAVPDLVWVVNTDLGYAVTLRKIPRAFAWEESSDLLSNLKVLQHSVAIRRLRCCFDHVRRHDSDLFQAMRAEFEALPPIGKIRFMTAPDTYYAMSRLPKEPSRSIIKLCHFLNGESAFHGLGPMNPGYSTALGDFYLPKEASGQLGLGAVNSTLEPVRGRYLGGLIPIDYSSPNIVNARGLDDADANLEYSTEESSQTFQMLEAAFKSIETVSPAATLLIKEYVKVIILLKVGNGSGSSSTASFPGRVVMSGIERCSPALLAGNLVHEAMHQLLYVLEYGGNFVSKDSDSRDLRIKSLWTGRDLALPSFFHACFVWYGLSNFFTQALTSDAFDRADVEAQLAKSLSGFRNRNPIELLAEHASLLRHDALKILGTLHGELRDRVGLNAA
jgi:hypothetical protein